MASGAERRRGLWLVTVLLLIEFLDELVDGAPDKVHDLWLDAARFVEHGSPDFRGIHDVHVDDDGLLRIDKFEGDDVEAIGTMRR